MGGILTPKNSTSTKTVNEPSYVTNAYQQSLGAAQSAASTPFTPYAASSQVAPLTDLQNSAISGIQGATGIAQPYINQAQSLVNAGTTPTTLTPFNAANVNQYMSPYQNDVINATQGQFNLLNAQQQSQLTGNAASQGALGGDRVGVAQAQLAGQQAAQEAPTLAGLENQNYAQGLGEFNTQQQTSLAQQEANAYTSLYGAGEQGNLGQLAQGSALAGYGAELQAGGLQQGTNQALATAGYNNYLQAQQYPFQTAGYLGNVASQIGGQYSGDTTSTANTGSSLLGSLAGLGLAGYGLSGSSGALGSGLSSLGSSISGLFGGSSGYGAAGTYNGQYYSSGGRKLADGGDTGDDMADPSTDFEDMSAGEEDPDEQIANSALSGIANPAMQQQQMQQMGGPMSMTPPQTGPQAQSGTMGLDPQHYAALSAGLGIMGSRGRPLEMIGQGGQQGLRAYEQERQIEAQAEYRQSMSQAATTRASALANHYQDADKKPQIIHGKTFQLYYPSSGETVDTHIDNPQWSDSQARIAAENKPHYQVVGTDNSDPSHPKTVMVDTTNPKNQITVDAAPGKGGTAQGGVFAFKYNAAKQSGMTDADALQFAGGHKAMAPEDINKIAMTQATAQANANKDNFDTPEAYDAYRQQAYTQNQQILMSGMNASKPAGGANPNGPPANGGGAPHIPAPVAVPPKFAKAPEGTMAPYNGWNWAKKGNQMVPISPITGP